MHIRNRLARYLHRQYRFVALHQPIGSMAIYHLFGVLIHFKPKPTAARNPGKRWLKTRMGGRILYWVES